METTVTGCKDCLLFYDGHRYEYSHICVHPNAPKDQTQFRSESEIKLKGEEKGEGIRKYTEITPITPSWCPIEKEAITISKQNK